jgi:hypothetical protein
MEAADKAAGQTAEKPAQKAENAAPTVEKDAPPEVPQNVPQKVRQKLPQKLNDKATRKAARKAAKKAAKKARRLRARLPLGTFWVGAVGRAALTIPATAMALSVARGQGRWPHRPDLVLALEFAAPAAFGLAGLLARMQAYLLWGRKLWAHALFGLILGAPLGAFEALVALIAAGGEPQRWLLRAALIDGAIAGAVVGVLVSLLVNLRIRGRFFVPAPAEVDDGPAPPQDNATPVATPVADSPAPAQ